MRPGRGTRRSPGEGLGRGVASLGRWTALAASLFVGCAPPPEPLGPADPTQVVYAEELGVDLSRMTRTSTGLYYEDLTEGVGPVATRNSRVWIHYVGYLPDGTVFDTSVGGEPMHFRLGGNEVIRGWNQGIPGMKKGGRRRLVVRPGLAYGSRGRGSVPPGATLIFEVQLVDVG